MQGYRPLWFAPKECTRSRKKEEMEGERFKQIYPGTWRHACSGDYTLLNGRRAIKQIYPETWRHACSGDYTLLETRRHGG